MTSDFKLSKVCAPVFVPLNENYELQLDYIKDYRNYLKIKGISGYMVNGGCGEFSSLTIDERKRVLEAWVGVCDDTDELLVNIGSCSLFDTIELGKHALQFPQVDKLAIVPPFYMPINNEYVLLNYIKSVKDALPRKCYILYYHIPMLSKVDISVEKLILIMKQTNYDCINAVKFTDQNFDDLCSLRISIDANRPFIKLYCGYELFLDKIDSINADGVILAMVNIFPEFLSNIFQRDSNDLGLKAKKLEKMKHFFQRCLDYARKHQFNMLALFKTACEYQSGIKLGPMRSPYNISAGHIKKFIEESLDTFVSDFEK